MELLPIELVSLAGDKLVTDSRRVAQHFGKDHKSVLRAIARLDCSIDFRRRNFAQTVEYRRNPSGGRPISSRVVTMTKDGFMFLAMGFSGPEAALIKEAYIDAFNAMAEQLERRDISLMRKLLDHELKDKDSKQRGAIAGRLLKRRRTEKSALENEEKVLMKEVQPTLFKVYRGGAA